MAFDMLGKGKVVGEGRSHKYGHSILQVHFPLQVKYEREICLQAKVTLFRLSFDVRVRTYLNEIKALIKSSQVINSVT